MFAMRADQPIDHVYFRASRIVTSNSYEWLCSI